MTSSDLVMYRLDEYRVLIQSFLHSFEDDKKFNEIREKLRAYAKVLPSTLEKHWPRLNDTDRRKVGAEVKKILHDDYANNKSST